MCFSDLRTARARLIDMFTDSTCTPEIMKKVSDDYFSLLQGLYSSASPLDHRTLVVQNSSFSSADCFHYCPEACYLYEICLFFSKCMQGLFCHWMAPHKRTSFALFITSNGRTLYRETSQGNSERMRF